MTTTPMIVKLGGERPAAVCKLIIIPPPGVVSLT